MAARLQPGRAWLRPGAGLTPLPPRGLHAAAAEPAGAGVLRGAAGPGPGGPARQPHHPRHAHHGRGRQRNGHQVSPAGGRTGGTGRATAGRTQTTPHDTTPHDTRVVVPPLKRTAPAAFAEGPALKRGRGLEPLPARRCELRSEVTLARALPPAQRPSGSACGDRLCPISDPRGKWPQTPPWQVSTELQFARGQLLKTLT